MSRQYDSFHRNFVESISSEDFGLIEELWETLFVRFYQSLDSSNQLLLQNCSFSLAPNAKSGLNFLIQCQHPLIMDVTVLRADLIESLINEIVGCVSEIWVYEQVDEELCRCYRHTTNYGKAGDIADI